MAPAVKYAEKPATTTKARSTENAVTAAAHHYQAGFGNQFLSEAVPVRCRSAATRRSGRRSGFTPSRFPGRRSRRRAPKIAAPGSTAFSRRSRIGLMRASRTG